MIIRKSIYLLLNILLILGALASIVTINGGKWIPKVLEFYEPKEMPGLNPSSELTPEGTGRLSTAENSDQTASGCLTLPVAGVPEWYYANAILAASNYCGQAQ
jgi:hypothetical protein